MVKNPQYGQTGPVPGADASARSPTELDALFDRTASLARRPRTVCDLPGGLTNRNYKVTTPGGTFVARISSDGSELLAIDRDCEYRHSVTGASARSARTAQQYRPDAAVWPIA